MSYEDYDYIPWDDIPTGDYLPNCTVQAKWTSLEDSETKAGVRMFKAVFEIEEPNEFAGRWHFENYVLGTPEEPSKINPTSFGARNLQKARIAAQVRPMTASKFCEFVETTQPSLILALKEPNPDDDFQSNSITRYAKLGEAQPGILKKETKKKPVKAPKPPKIPTKPASQIKPSTEQIREDVNESVPGAQRERASEQESSIPLIDCRECGAKVPATEYGEHMMQHAMSN